MPETTLIVGPLTARPDGSFETMDIRIRGDSVVDVEPKLDASPEDVILDGRRRLAVPGMVDAHYHSNEAFLKGSFDDMPLEVWLLHGYPLVNEVPQTERDLYIRTLVGCLELLRTGTTTVVDFLYELPSPTMSTLEPVMAAYRDAGMRVVLALSIWDLPWTETVPLDLDLVPIELREPIAARPPAASEWLALCRDAIGQWHGDSGRMHVGLAPSGPQRCTPELLVSLAGMADDHDLAVHTHCLETRLQSVTGREMLGKTLVAHLDDIGVLSRRWSLVHGIWVTDADVEIMARAGATAVHLPQANLKLGDGIAPIPAYLAAGVNVALGTDGISTNDTRDMFEAVKLAAMLHKVHQPRYERWVGADDAWRMATTGGARSANLDAVTGSIEPGRRADIVLLDLDDDAFTPLNEPLYHLAYCLPSRAVREVFVDGQLVVSEGRSTLVDQEAVMEEVRERGAALRSHRPDAYREAGLLHPAVRDAYLRAWRTDVGAHRFSGPYRPDDAM
jgi:cytosine/adenosine deaminase-related metal-dependent hydrolase